MINVLTNRRERPWDQRQVVEHDSMDHPGNAATAPRPALHITRPVLAAVLASDDDRLA